MKIKYQPDHLHQQKIQKLIGTLLNRNSLNNNEIFHRYLTEGITVEYQRDGETKGEQLWLIDWDTPTSKSVKFTIYCFALHRLQA